MNRIYRTLWNQARGMYVVAHEKSKSKGKASSTRKAIVEAVAAAVLAMAATPIIAATDCNTSGDITIDGAATTTCNLDAGENLTVTGSIITTSNAVEVFNGSVAGNIDNSGSIGGSIFGINVANSSGLGNITNNGTISGINAINIQDGGTVAGIFNASLINGSASGVYIVPTSVSGSADASFLTNGISNAGTINGGIYGGVWMDSNSLSGGIINSGTTSVISGAYDGVHVFQSTFSGGISNEGLINGGTNSGIGVIATSPNGTSFSGDIINSGTTSVINGANFGIQISNTTFSGSIVNEGKVTGLGQAGIILQNSSMSGSIINSGASSTISGGPSGGVFANTATLNGIDNEGTIKAAGSYAALRLENTSVTGDITNRGMIQADYSAILIKNSHVQGGVSNSGSIIGGNYTAFLIDGSSSVVGGLINSGLISGAPYSVVSAGLSLSEIVVAGNNSAKFIGAVYAPNTPMSVASGAKYTMDDGQQFTVSGFTNDGTLKIDTGSTGTITGNFAQSSSGTLQIGATGTASGQHGIIKVEGNATLGGTINLNLWAPIANNSTISGVLTATALNGTTFTGVSDNSVLLDFTAAYTGGTTVSLISASASPVCSGTLSGTNTGPCFVAFDASNLINNGTINGAATGIKMLAGSYSGSIVNNGVVEASSVGLLQDGGAFVGNITNTRSISGIDAGMVIQNLSTIVGNIVNSGTLSVIQGSTFNGDFSGTYSGNGTLVGGVGLEIRTSSIQGAVINAGSIFGDDIGVSLGAVNFFNNQNSTSISGDISLTGGISNSGVIAGELVGLSISNGFNTNGINTGAITLDQGITNTGLVKGRFAGILIGGYSSNTLSNGIHINGDITNSGTISGNTSVGLFMVGNTSLSGSIINSGTISGAASIVAVGFNGFTTSNNISGGIINQEQGLLSGALKVGSSVTNHGTISLPAGTNNNSFIGGDFTQSSTGVLRIGVTDAVAGEGYSTLYVGGTASLSGTLDVDVNTVNTLNGGDTLEDVITAGTTISGTFDSITDNSNLFDFTGIYNANDFDLTISGGINTALFDAAQAAGNTAGFGAARILDRLRTSDPTGPISSLFLGVARGKENEALSQVLPLQSGGMSQSIRNSLRGTNRIIQARQEGQHGRSSGDEFFGDQHAWFKPFGSWTNQDDRKGVSGFDANTFGMVFGADAEINDNNRLGLAFSYARSNIDSNSNVAKQTADVNSYQLALYGSHNLSDTTDLNFQFDLGKHDNNGLRDITFASTRAKSDYTSWSAHLGAGLAHTYTLSEKTTLTPSVRADYTRIRDESYSERDAGALNLRVNSNTTEELILGVDGKLAHALTDSATLTANLGLGYDVINEQASLTSAFAGAPSISFTTQGLDPSPWLMRGGLGVVSKATETVEISARYDIEARKDFDNQTASVKVRWAF